ncbi:Putative AC transposase [Glycine soja]|uniref:Putative AC transposase n=1 Tax=Glycine soja TaxID=3848 RepID=A0A0B2R6R1_GLYSO|nr:Putative AC transposase [Glycine soja]
MVDTLEDDRVVVNSDMKKDPVVVVGTDAQPGKDLAESEMLPGTDAELNKDLSNSETLPNKELPVINGEAVVALLDQCLGNSEEPMNGHHPENCELLTNNQPDNAEASRSSQTVDSKALPTNQSANSEDLSNSQLVSSEAPLDMKVSQPSNQQVNTEALPNHINASNSETHTSNDVLVSETQHSEEVVMSETVQGNEGIMYETQQSNEVVMSEMLPDSDALKTQTCNDWVMSEALPENELANHTRNHNNPLSHSETGPDNQLTNLHMIPEDQLPQSESLPHSEPLPYSEPLTDTHLSDIKLSNSEALSHDQLADSQMLSHYELENTETMHHNQIVNSQANYEMTFSDAIPSCEIINAETPLNNEDCVPETQPIKRRKKRSIVWEHFTIEAVSPECRRARCKRCAQTFAYSTGSKVAGTSHLKSHVAKGICSALLRNHDHNQLTPYTARTRASGAGDASATHSALTHVVAVCLSDWGLEGRLFSVTCNKALSNVALENLRPLLSVKNPLILNGQLLVGNCIACTLSSVAKDLLGSAQDLINKIHDSVKYVKTSELHAEKFLELKQHLQVPSERSLFIDDQIHWNTSYQMLVAASELKTVFSCLDTSDPDYKGAPSMQDWKLVETLCSYLKLLFDAANILTTTTHPTTITFFHEVWILQLDAARAVTTEDPFISSLNKIMSEKIDEYWRECSLVLALAVVMDPRFKMKLVEFSFAKIYGEDAHFFIRIVDDGIHELFHEYVTNPLPLTPAYAENGSVGNHNMMEEFPGGP